MDAPHGDGHHLYPPYPLYPPLPPMYPPTLQPTMASYPAAQLSAMSLPSPPNPPPYRHIEPQDVQLQIRQQPREALVTAPGKERIRKPVDPPPIVQMIVSQDVDPAQNFMQSPYLFMACTLWDEDDRNPVAPNESGASGKKEPVMAGCLVSSLHRLKDGSPAEREGAFFVFGDVSIRVQGRHRLRFSLYDIRKDTSEAVFLGQISSEPFNVVLQKDFRGLEESTVLSRAFSEQGVRLRLRKEPRGFNSNKRSYSYSQGYSQEESPPTAKPEVTAEYSTDYSDPHGHSGHGYPEAKRFQGPPGQGFFDSHALNSSMPSGAYPNDLAVRPPQAPYTPASLLNHHATALPKNDYVLPQSEFTFRADSDLDTGHADTTFLGEDSLTASIYHISPHELEQQMRDGAPNSFLLASFAGRRKVDYNENHMADPGLGGQHDGANFQCS